MTTMKKTTNVNQDPSSVSLDHVALMRDQKHELDELNNRFSKYVLALRQKSQENDDLQKDVDAEKLKQSTFASRVRRSISPVSRSF